MHFHEPCAVLSTPRHTYRQRPLYAAIDSFFSQSSVWEVRLLEVIRTRYDEIKNPPPLIKGETKKWHRGWV